MIHFLYEKNKNFKTTYCNRLKYNKSQRKYLILFFSQMYSPKKIALN
jgi:hypothetical protein